VSRLLPALCLGATLAVALGGCSAPGSGGPGASEGEISPAPASYRVRGMLRRLPAADAARRALLVQHEAIPELVDLTGEVVGMDAMAMEFDVGADVDLAGLAPGDKILFTLEVDWDAEPPAVIRGVERLAPDTDLNL